MQDDMGLMFDTAPRLDTRVLRHMMYETIELLDASAEHTNEACHSTDAAMALTRIDWMLMGIFNWLTRQLRADDLDGQVLGEPVSIVGINQSALSEELKDYAHIVDRLHARVRQLDSLILAGKTGEAVTPKPRQSGQVLHIFGDPEPGVAVQNAVLSSRQRLKSAFGGN